jgi:hypothetical protein
LNLDIVRRYTQSASASAASRYRQADAHDVDAVMKHCFRAAAAASSWPLKASLRQD